MTKAKLTFAGGTGGPTGANFLFETEKDRVLVDCGLTQGEESLGGEINAEPFSYDPGSISTLFVTHSHIDHIGRIPFLVRNGFRGRIVSTPPTKEIAALMFEDAHAVMQHDAKKKGETPLYDVGDYRAALALWETAEYGETIRVSDELSVVFHDAGHVLGSAMAEFQLGNKKMLFTGDLGNSPSPLLRDTEYVKNINYLLMESVYGDREHEDKDERKELLEAAILETEKKKGVLLIPVFSLERTQVLLSELNELVENRRVEELPVFLDSPLGIKITEVYRKHSDYFNTATRAEIARGDDVFAFPKLRFTPRAEDSHAIRNVHPPKIIIAGSGMSNGGRILSHEREYLSDPKTTLLVVGYQAVGTPGRLLVEGAKEIKLNGETVKVRASIKEIHGYSAHRDVNGLFDFVENMKDSLDRVFVVMGETKAATFFSQRVRDYLGLRAEVPKRGETVELDF